MTAEDAVQEATFKAWRARDRLRPDSDLKPWFLTIVANQYRQERRSRWWSVLKQADVSTDGVVDQGANSDDAAELRRLLARLPHHQRLILVLRYYLDFSYEDVAHALRISGPAARSRVHRASTSCGWKCRRCSMGDNAGDQPGGRAVRSRRSGPDMSSNAPAQVILIDLSAQKLVAYDRGCAFLTTPVTTGRAGLATSTGSFRVYVKYPAHQLVSPWPKGDPNWYPTTTVHYFLGLNPADGFAIRSAEWEPPAEFGPGSENGSYASHGDVNVPTGAAERLYQLGPCRRRGGRRSAVSIRSRSARLPARLARNDRARMRRRQPRIRRPAAAVTPPAPPPAPA